jgi:hypothetical protein
MWLDIDISVMSNASSRSARRKISSGSPGSAVMRRPGIAMLPSRIGRERSVGTHAMVTSSTDIRGSKGKARATARTSSVPILRALVAGRE